MKQIVCDRCGKRIKKDYLILRWTEELDEQQLCTDCMSDLYDWIKKTKGVVK